MHTLFIMLYLSDLCHLNHYPVGHNISREPGSRETVNLTLFGTISSNIYELIFTIENILLFSIVIGIVQYITKREYLQTDDIIMNVLGTLLGYLLFLFIRKYHDSDECLGVQNEKTGEQGHCIDGRHCDTVAGGIGFI